MLTSNTSALILRMPETGINSICSLFNNVNFSTLKPPIIVPKVERVEPDHKVISLPNELTLNTFSAHLVNFS